jgi:hypothetical protein
MLMLFLLDMDVLLACKKSFSVPFSHIITPVVAKPLEAQKLFMGIHMGTRFPGVYNAGSFSEAINSREKSNCILKAHSGH